ncbi:MAG: hypothetical protein ABSC11_01460 [Smithella sp.]|jgi:hypothetical protein
MSDYDRRNYIRFPSEPNEIVSIYYLDEDDKKTIQRMGLAQNESLKGFCAVFVGEVNFKQGQEVIYESCTRLKVKAKVAWIKKLEGQITKAGFFMID